jgi:hypothetical protein
VDIYSLGCVLFHMVAGAPPYGGTTQMEVILKHIRGPIPDLSQVAPTVPSALVPIVAKMMAKDPKDRFQSPAQVRKALQTLLQPALAPRIGAWWRWTIAGVAGVLVIGLAASWCGHTRPISVASPDARPVAQDPVAGQAGRPEPARPRARRASVRSPVRGEAREGTPPRGYEPAYEEPPASPRQRGAAALSDAVQARDGDRLRALLDRGVPPNTGDGSFSPLHHAVLSGDPRLVRMLLEKGANPNARDSAGETPLHEALRRRNHEMIGALLDFGANPNLPDRSGRTPLQAAGGDGFLTRKLLEKGAH